MKKAYSFILKLIFLISAVLVLCIALLIQTNTNHNISSASSDYIISHESGFYNHSLRVRITPLQNAAVYYSTDGSEPSNTSAASTLYKSPVSLKAGNKETPVSLRFRLYFDDGTISKVYNYSYILGHFVHSRYHTYVVTITGDPDSLFGYENGIFTAGKRRDDFLAANPDQEINFNAPANYNQTGMDSERPVSVQIFDKNGTLLTSQDCGLRIFGNSSRENIQKSFQLFARKSYDTYGKFHISLFPDLHRETDGTIPDRSNRLIFRNSGDDFCKAFLRDTLVQQLAADYGFPFSTPYVPAAVYINGEYTGFYWVKEPFSDGLAEELYGASNGHFERVTLWETSCTAGEEGEDSDDIIKDYQSVYDTYVDADLTDDRIYESLCRQVDVENYLRYYALQIYIGNKDWPYNNIRAWRYVADDGNYTENTVFDGRYRYLLYDTDYAFGLVLDEFPSYSCEEDNIAVILTREHSPFFKALMHRADCRAAFANNICDLMNSTFSFTSVFNETSRLISGRDAELNYYIENLLSDVTSMETVNAVTTEILLYAQNRPAYMHTFLQMDYGIFYPYFLFVESPEDAKVSINSIDDAGSDFQGIYYADNYLHLKASVNEGHQFSCWLINGTQYQEEELTLSSEQLKELLGLSFENDEYKASPEGCGTIGYAEYAQNPVLHISLVETDNPDSLPVVSRIRAKGANDLVELSNPSEHTVSLHGLYLSDDAANLQKTKLPDIILAPDETVSLYGKKYKLAATPPEY